MESMRMQIFISIVHAKRKRTQITCQTIIVKERAGAQERGREGHLMNPIVLLVAEQ